MWKCSWQKQEVISGLNVRKTEATPQQCRAAFLQMRKCITAGHTDWWKPKALWQHSLQAADATSKALWNV